MRKVTLTVVGIAGLALLLCGSGEVLAQADGTVAGGAEASPAELRQSVLQLQSEVAQLRQELALLRAELANVTANLGVGGAGQAGVAPAEAPTGVGATTGEAVVDAFYTGTVRSVSNRQLVLQDDNGQPFALELGAQTRIISNGQRISAQQLEQGTRVRVTVDLLMGRNQATEVTTLPER
jgi:hypothetical protein